MRRLARILEQVRQYEGNSKLSLEEILKPSQFKNLIQATKSVSGYETESDTYKSPSFALQTGTLLKRAIQAALSIEIQRDNPSNEKRTDLNNLIHLIETDWAYEISTQAVQNLAINRFNKPTLIPLTKDIKGKRLEEIELDENTDNVIEDNDSDDEMKIDELKESNQINQINNIEENEPANIDEIRCPKKVKEKFKEKRHKVPWTSEQKQLTEKFFKKNIQNKIPPRKHEVDILKKKYPDVFTNKSWAVIKVYVCNKYNKM
ncbi:hypothetical protein RN001_002870 [Aquatica leii]|uniref:Uncharacterized protein n=1 Tax=Aquatica leii TaxID=1421715 RepID=A0AAN7PHH2_9COLE|nr:hypothetical protein RN001_002870 [Aquatica leii]